MGTLATFSFFFSAVTSGDLLLPGRGIGHYMGAEICPGKISQTILFSKPFKIIEGTLPQCFARIQIISPTPPSGKLTCKK